jgi:hypothetical protein
MSGPAPPARPIPKPLAAYRLGLLSYTTWMWHETFWEMPGDEETWDGVPFSVALLREVRLVLTREFDPRVFAELPRVFDDLDRLTAVLIEAARTTGYYEGVPFGSRRVPGITHWQELRTLADLALDDGSWLRPYYGLGVAVGQLQLGLWNHDQATIDSGDPELRPDIVPVVDAALRVPEDQVRQIPLLRSLVRLVPVLRSGGRVALIRRFFTENRDAFRNYFIDALDHMTIVMMARTLDTHIQDCLNLNPEPVTRSPAATNPDVLTPQGPTRNSDTSPLIPSAVDSQKPRWIRDRSELWVGKKLVRKVSEQACFIYILDEFESRGWPDTIDDTHPKGPDRDRLRLTLRSLNRGTSMIQFGRTRKGKGIYWSRKARPRTP